MRCISAPEPRGQPIDEYRRELFMRAKGHLQLAAMERSALPAPLTEAIMANEGQKMVHRAFTVIRREGDDDFWLEIGANFEHKDGKGLTVALQAHPLGGRIVLREVGSGPREKAGRGSDESERRDGGEPAPRQQSYKAGQRRR
jgi:hypothetical protein